MDSEQQRGENAPSLGGRFAAKPHVSDDQMLEAVVALGEAFPLVEDEEMTDFDKLIDDGGASDGVYPDEGIEYEDNDFPDSEDDVALEDRAFWDGVKRDLAGEDASNDNEGSL